MKGTFGAILIACVLAACGGDDGGSSSGVDQGKAITELDAGEVSALCEWAIAEQGGEGRVEDCGDFDYEVGTVAECEADYGGLPAGCSSVTVGELEAWVEVLAEDPCNGFGAEACAEFLQCALGG